MTINVEEYYKKYGPMVMRRCEQLLGDREKSAELMQDTFVSLLRNHGRLKRNRPLPQCDPL